MNVKATTARDLECYKLSSMVRVYGKTNPRTVKIIAAVISAAILLFSGWLVLYGFKENDSGYIVMAFFYTLAVLANAYIWTVLPAKIDENRAKRFGLPEYSFEFDEEKVKITKGTINEDSDHAENSTLTINYSLLYKVIECSEYIFIFLPSGQNIGFSKSNIENGTAEDIRKAMQAALGKKYKIANY